MKYPGLPIMQCDNGCGACCGFAPCNEEEFQRIKTYCADNDIVPKRQGDTCPLYQNGKCQVYHVRPFVCRLFGHSERLTCCKGYNTNLPEKRLRRIDADYLKQGHPNRSTHDLCFTESEQRMLFEHALLK